MRRSKWGNKITKLDGYTFKSGKEAARYGTLKLFQQAKQIQKLQIAPRFELKVYGIKVCTYVADFQYETPGKEKPVVEDVKALDTRTGSAIITADARIKHKLFKILYPEYDFQIYA